MADDLRINDRFTVPGALLEFSYARSGGPGGQHVNTAETRVRLHFRLSEWRELGHAARMRLEEAHGAWITNDGDVVITDGSGRSRLRNLERVRERLRQALLECIKVPKRRRKTKPSRGAMRRRIKAKKQRSETKALRGRVKE